MNYGALLLVGAGGVVLLITFRGTYKAIAPSLGFTLPTGGSSPSSGSSGGPPPAENQGGGTFGASLPGAGNQYQALAYNDALAVGLDPAAFVKQIYKESGFNPNAVSPAGAVGIAQFMPSTAAGMGINPRDPVAALKAAAQYMKNLVNQFGGSLAKGLAAYNAGSGTVQNAINKSKATGQPWYSFLPAETQNYIMQIEGSYK